MKVMPFILLVASSMIQFYLLRKNKPRFKKAAPEDSPLKNYKYFLQAVFFSQISLQPVNSS
jgi:hypothetical protein